MQGTRCKVLVLAASSEGHSSVVHLLKEQCDVAEVASIDEAIDSLRHSRFDAIFTDSADFLPLERALVSQQASLILNTIGEGVCIVDGEARCNWMNKKMQAWPARVHEKIRRTCQEAFELFSSQSSHPQPSDPLPTARSRRYQLNIEDQQYFEMIASPVISPAGAVVQVVAVVWDATTSKRLQQKIDAIDRAGRELVRIESDAISKLHISQRLKLLEDKIISYTRELMHFDHFAIRVLDRKSHKLELVISVGLPPEALAVEMYAEPDNNGISGHVAATGRSYICPDVERDPRYVTGLDAARSSLTVPLRLHDKIIGVFNIESRQRGAFNEDDRQFAEIFARYVAIALNILDLMVVERVSTSHKVTDDVLFSCAGPLNDIASDANMLIDNYIGNDELQTRLKLIVQNVEAIRQSLRQCAQGPNTILGSVEVSDEADPVLAGRRILIADDEPNIRTTIHDILRRFNVEAMTAGNGSEAIALVEQHSFDLILSDIKMPDKTGYEVFAAARKRNAAIPVILMTGFGYDPNHSIVRASQEGLQAVLFKPFKVDQLLTEVRKALQSVPR